MTLTDLIDLEARIAADQGVADEALRARDHRVAAGLGALTSDRGALLSGWLAALREGDSVGQRLVRGYRLAGLVLLLVGLGSGWGVAAALLAYDGQQPVNVLSFLMVMVGLQGLLLLGLLVSIPASLMWPRLVEGLPLVGDARWLVAWLARGLGGLGRRLGAPGEGETVEGIRAALHRLRSRESLYRPIERWTLLGLTQLFGVAFNVAALAACAQRVATSDLAFAWSTTLDVSAAGFHRLVEAVALPWVWLVPQAVPSLEVIEATRFSRLADAYVGAAEGARAVDAALVGAWWPYLVAAVIAWGLLPRVAGLLTASALRRRALARVPLDTADVDRVVRRLLAPLVQTRARGPEAAGPGADAPAAADALHVPTAADEACHALLWRDVPGEAETLGPLVDRALGWRVAAVSRAGGLAHAADEAAITAASQGAGPLLMVAEAWEAPDKAVFHLLRQLRQRAGERRRLLVLLVDGDAGAFRAPDPEDVATWRDRLATLEDPWLGVEALEVGP